MIDVGDSRDARPSRLADARAEFVASLGRRLEALRQALQALEQEPRSSARRDYLLRRVHAVSAAAKVLGFASVAEALTHVESLLQRAGRPEAQPGDLSEVARAIDLIPSLVSGQSLSILPGKLETEPVRPARLWPIDVVVYGPETLVEALSTVDEHTDVERATELLQAAELVRRQEPDVVVIDSDWDEARELAAELSGDPLLETLPLVIVGEFNNPGSASEYVALGATRVLVKPVSPDTLQTAVFDAVQSSVSRPERAELGNTTVDALAERLAAEVRRGLVEAVEPGGRELAIELGVGADVLGAIWGAVARVREVVSLRSGGAVRFARTGPEGAIPVAPWRAVDQAAGARGPTPARSEDGVSLERRRILVADDDPAVAWFISGLLRAVGAEVLEAHDGRRALDLAYQTWPDVVVSDVLMPELDGFSLCRDLRRDVALRDVPVILLSWKEDLLQRLREIGADASGYLRKEASASTIIQRVREVLRPRARVELRLEAGGEVRGRLDGLTPRLILELCCARRPNCRITLRDAAFLYELQIREGRLCCATRTSADGTFVRGGAVLGSLLGASAGRFVVVSEEGACRNDFHGDLAAILAEPIRRARSLQRALGEARLLQVERVEFDEAALSTYSTVRFEPAEAIIAKLREGDTPRELVLSGAASPKLLELVLVDLARHGAIAKVLNSSAGHEPEAASEPDFLPDKRAEYTSLTPPPAFTLLFSPAAPEAERRGHETPAPHSAEPSPSVDLQSILPTEGLAEAPSSAEPDPVELGEAVLGSLSDASNLPASVSSESGAEPDAPETPRSSRFEVVQTAERASEPAPAAPQELEQPQSVEPPRASEPAPEPAPASEAAEGFEPKLVPSPKSATPSAEVTPRVVRRAPVGPKARASSTKPKPKPEGSSLKVGLLFVGAGVLAYLVVHALVAPREKPVAPSAPSAVVSLSPAVPSSAAPAAIMPARPQTSGAAPAPMTAVPAPQDLPLPPGVLVADVKGLLEVDTGDKRAIYVDGAFVGRGPMRRVPLDPGTHQVELRDGASRNVFSVAVAKARRTRVSLGGDVKRAEGADSL